MKSERLGFVMIGASLSVIALIMGLFFYSQRGERLAQIRVQGVSLARLLSSMPMERLAPALAQQGLLDVVGSLQANTDFAYATVDNPEGVALAQATAQGILPPRIAISPEPASWYGQRRVSDKPNDQVFQEFHAPIVTDGERVAQVRIGYLEPPLMEMGNKLSFLAMLALPVFLLTTLFYLLVKREIVPLKTASDQIKKMLDEQPLSTVELTASGEVGEFVHNFNRVVRAAEQRILKLEEQSEGMLTSSKILSYQKARIESTLQSLPDAVVVMDEEGVVTYASRKLEMISGVDTKSILGKKVHEWCTKEEVLGLLSGIGSGAPRRVYGGSTEIKSDIDPQKRFSVNVYPLFSPRDEANIWGTLMALRDVSAESLAKEARKEFIARLAHELKNPLHVIGMYTEVLRDDDRQVQGAHIESCNVIQDELERANALIKNMLSIAELEMGSMKIERTRTRMGDFLKDVFTNLTHSVDTGTITCRIENSRELSSAYIDKEMMRVAINNLMTNAIKYNRPDGEVVLAAEESDSEYVISVRDTGIGIPESDLDRIFDRFFRANDDAVKERGGHGLGLALAKEIVELHDGELRVESRHGEGSKFSIIIHKNSSRLKEVV